MENITAVEILKRADLPPHDVPKRFKSVEVRIGRTEVGSSHGLQAIVVNHACAVYAGGDMEMAALIFCTRLMSGRYVTVQSTAVTYLEIDELNLLALR